MRKKSPILNSLWTHTTQDVLAVTLLRPHHEWYMTDLAAHLGVRPSTLQRALADLTTAGILRRRAHGNRIYYQANEDCLIFNELSAILAKTAGIADVVRDALTSVGDKLALAFIHGSVAEGREDSGSDVDVIAVGDVPNADIAMALREAHRRLGRDINVTRYTPQEFADKANSGHHFLSSVLKKPKIFLIGNEHDLGEVISRQANRSGTDGQSGTR